jgi:hypothetical protein
VSQERVLGRSAGSCPAKVASLQGHLDPMSHLDPHNDPHKSTPSAAPSIATRQHPRIGRPSAPAPGSAPTAVQAASTATRFGIESRSLLHSLSRLREGARRHILVCYDNIQPAS